MNRKMIQPRIIEFYGLPGCGKTTISKLLCESLAEEFSLEVVRPGKTKVIDDYSLLCLPKYWTNVSRLFNFVRLYKTKKHPRIVLQPERYRHIYHRYLKSNATGFFVVDQGIIQSLISISYLDTLPDSEQLSSYVSSLNNLPILLVYCKCDTTISKQRMKDRVKGGSRLEQLDDECFEQAVQVQSSNFKKINSILNDKCDSIQVMSIDTTKDPQFNVSKIVSFIKHEMEYSV